MRLEQQNILRGTVTAVVFQSYETGYTVLRLRCEDGSAATVVGQMPQVTVGEHLMITGAWSTHPAYGPQFRAEVLEQLMPQTEQEILTYLSAGTVRGIGAKTAQKIVALFHAEALDILERMPEKLAVIPGISRKKALEIGESFRSQLGVRRLVEYLSAHGLPVELALRLYRAYGQQAMDAIGENPYLLTEPAFHAPFEKVDAFALELGLDGADLRRVAAGILFELRHNLGNGHTFLPAQKLVEATVTLLGLDGDTVQIALEQLAAEQRVILDPLRELTACYLPEFYEAEQYVQQRLHQMLRLPPDRPAGLEALLEEAAQTVGIEYAQRQRQAIAMAAVSRVMILTGGPGTGKSTTVNGMLALFERMKLTTVLAAPTGRAAKRLQELSGAPAATIHRLLEAQFSQDTGEMVFTHDESAPIEAEVLVVDECSMVDLLLMENLLRALPPQCRLILVGDPDQLPSVGPGNVLSDLVRSGVIPTVRLTEIFRQAQKSLIVMNAHAVNAGQLPELGARDRDFFFLRRTSPASVVQTVCELCARRLPENLHIAPEDIQVLSPSRRYEVGTGALNLALQAVLNPPDLIKREKQRGEFLLREGDRVMQIRNNYDILWKKTDGSAHGTGIYNGDIGVVQEIRPQDETLTILFDDDRLALYSFELLPELELAYAMTVHKSQGSEYRAVVLVLAGGSPFLLTRNVLYTAITRARELLIVVGNEQTVAKMVENDRRQRRYSGLRIRLAEGTDT
ncbi:MAG: ATP-dependent RecD-like DNA helicase [Clostridiales bacterium]|nr:ATP-dependent RecD-like DNA helicase [Clostridiales bacterium]